MARWCKKVEYETSLCPHNLSQWACPFLAPNSMDWQKQQHFESPVTLPQLITLPFVTKPKCLLEESSSPPPASLSSSLFCHVRVASRAEQGVTSVMTCVNAPWSGFLPSPVSLSYSQTISKINLSHSTLVSGSAAGTTQPKAVPEHLPNQPQCRCRAIATYRLTDAPSTHARLKYLWGTGREDHRSSPEQGPTLRPSCLSPLSLPLFVDEASSSAEAKGFFNSGMVSTCPPFGLLSN